MKRAASSGDVMKLPLSSALEQLPRGAIRVPFRELRSRTAPDLFSDGSDADEAPVEVPLSEVLSRLKHSHLARRAEQKQVCLPDDVPSVFAPRQPHGGEQLAPKFEVKLDQPALKRPPVNPPNPGLEKQLRLAASPEASSAAAKPAISFPGTRAAAPTVPTAPSATPSSPQVPANSVPEPVRVSFASLTAGWPDALKREAMARYLSATVAFPFAELEASMKRGRAVFTWKQIRLWMSPRPSVELTEHDARQLELPLPVLAPLFLARRASTPSPKKAETVAEIPDLFARRSEDEKAPLIAPAVAPPTSSPSESPPASLERRITDSLASIPAAGKSRETPLPAASIPMPREKRPAGQGAILPADLIERACRLGGVAGAMLASSDGFVIASQLPPGMSAETAAAFLPQIHSKVAQCTRELKLGQASEMELMVDGVPLQIRSTGNAFFAVLGKAGEPLPKLQLASLASQLSQRTQ